MCEIEGIPVMHGDLAVLPQSMTDAFCLLQDVPILYMTEVLKVNRRGKRQRRFVIITPTHLYSCTESGSIQRCVAVQNIAEVHTWNGLAPQVGLKIPSEYDMFFYLSAATDMSALAAALQFAASAEARGGSMVTVVEGPEELDIAAYCLERPKDCQWVKPAKFSWCVGSVGEVPASGIACDALKPFVSSNSMDLSVFPVSTSMSSCSVDMGDGAPCGLGSALPMHGSQQDITQTMRESSSDCNGDEEAFFSATPVLADVVEGNPVGVAVPKYNIDGRSKNSLEMTGARELIEALQCERSGRMEERENWCLLLAAERRNTYQLRQSIVDLRGQVLALTSQNLALRAESLARQLS